MRTLSLWCPDWPVTSLRRAGRAPEDAPVVVMGDGGRVWAASTEARTEGVRRGLRRREAEARCPGAAVVDADPGLEARTFEAVARALDAVTARLAIDRPGLVSFPIRGPSRFFGGDDEVARRALAAVDSAVGDGGARVGVADSRLAAFLAARRTTAAEPAIVLDASETAAFLASRSVAVLREHGLSELAGLFRRLGIATLGDLTALPESAVAARFGTDGVLAHHLARGLDDGPGALAAPPPELAETTELDPPAQRVDVAAFAARALAERLLERLARRGLALTRVRVEAETEHGEHLARVWRFAGPFTEAALAQRARWQLEAWVERGEADARDEVTGGLTLLRLVPEEVIPARGHQLDFWGGDARAGERATRVLARLQGMLGHEAVVQPVLRGGRTPAEQTAWVPFGDAGTECVRTASRSGATRYAHTEKAPPWPGAVPPPAPALVLDPPLPAFLVDASGAPVTVSGRGELSAPPARLSCQGLVDAPVQEWAGPWTHDVRFWDSSSRRRRALFQVVTGGVACLISLHHGGAAVEALYD